MFAFLINDTNLSLESTDERQSKFLIVVVPPIVIKVQISITLSLETTSQIVQCLSAVPLKLSHQ
jgi:hypothetical protein